MISTTESETRPRADTTWIDQVAVVGAIGNTPLLVLGSLAKRHGLPANIQICLKAEWSNPGGSVKDRPALAIIRDAFARGELANGRTLLDSTSGNTGIAYAMLGAALGFPVEIVIPASASMERYRILESYGANVIRSDAYDGSNGAILHAQSIAEANPERYFFADQYGNPANPRAHFEATGPELWRQTSGRITHFIAGLGTTGTLMGTGRYLKQCSPVIELVAVQPADSFHAIEGLKHMPTAIVPSIYDETVPDRQLAVETDVAYDSARELAAVEGLFCGTSTGATVAAMIRRAHEIAELGDPAVMVAISPDNGSKYLSTALWDS